MYCQYYKAKLNIPKTWFVSGVFRNEDNLVFARALDGREGVFEFFVPKDHEQKFLDIMEHLVMKGYILSYKKDKNRLIPIL
jgi:hypothetical protein